MSKKSIAFLVFAIIFFVLAIGIFAYSKIIENNSEENNIVSQTQTDNSGFIFYDENENSFNMSNFEGSPIAMVFWSSDTENSFEVVEMIESIYDDYKDDITFLIINTEEKTKNITETIANCGYSFQIYYDKDNLASEYYEYEKLPTLIFLESSGDISNKIEGEITEDSLTANLDIISKNY